jgi:hypothetical protein
LTGALTGCNGIKPLDLIASWPNSSNPQSDTLGLASYFSY